MRRGWTGEGLGEAEHGTDEMREGVRISGYGVGSG